MEQRHRSPLRRRQTADSRVKALSLITLLKVRLDRIWLRLCRDGTVQFAPALQVRDMPGAAPGHDPISPGRKRALVLEAAQSSRDLQPSRLDDITCRLIVTQEPPSMGSKAPMPASHQLGEGLLVT